MSFLLDANIISEFRKGERCDPHVSAWCASIADADLFLSTLGNRVLAIDDAVAHRWGPWRAGSSAAADAAPAGGRDSRVAAIAGHSAAVGIPAPC
jgi:hypothetical protein